MTQIEETEISRAILQAHCDKLAKQLTSDVVVAGAGPSGLTAAAHLARHGKRVTVIEKRLAPGGGIWGGAMGMNDVVVQEEAIPILDEAGVRHHRRFGGLYVVDAMELASALCLDAIRSGAVLLNLLALEDLCVREQRVTGVVVNRTTLAGALPVDPIVLMSRAVIDASGHEAVAVERLRSRGLFPSPCAGQGLGEGPMDAAAGEAFVVDRTGQVYPGLWVTGMSVCATFGGPRMGPIFGGMLLSGRKVAEMILASGSPEQLKK